MTGPSLALSRREWGAVDPETARVATLEEGDEARPPRAFVVLARATIAGAVAGPAAFLAGLVGDPDGASALLAPLGGGTGSQCLAAGFGAGALVVVLRFFRGVLSGSPGEHVAPPVVAAAVSCPPIRRCAAPPSGVRSRSFGRDAVAEPAKSEKAAPESLPPPVVDAGVARRIELQGSPTRCPRCLGAIDPKSEAWTACGGCLARHHSRCWTSRGRCAACGGAIALRVEAAAAGRASSPRTTRRVAVASVAVSLLAAVGFATSLAGRKERALPGVAARGEGPGLLRPVRHSRSEQSPQWAQAKTARHLTLRWGWGGAMKDLAWSGGRLFATTTWTLGALSAEVGPALQWRFDRRVVRVAVSADERTIVVASSDRALVLVPAAEGALENMLELTREHDAPRAVAVSPDGRRALVSTRTGPSEGTPASQRILLWDVERRECTRTIVPELDHWGSDWSASVAFVGSDRVVASGRDGIEVFDAASGSRIRAIGGPFYGRIALSRDGRLAAAGLPFGAVGVFELATGRDLATLAPGDWSASGLTKGGVSAVALCPDGKHIVAGDGGGVRLWDLATGVEIASVDCRQEVVGVVFLDCTSFAVATASALLRFDYEGPR